MPTNWAHTFSFTGGRTTCVDNNSIRMQQQRTPISCLRFFFFRWLAWVLLVLFTLLQMHLTHTHTQKAHTNKKLITTHSFAGSFVFSFSFFTMVIITRLNVDKILWAHHFIFLSCSLASSDIVDSIWKYVIREMFIVMRWRQQRFIFLRIYLFQLQFQFIWTSSYCSFV